MNKLNVHNLLGILNVQVTRVCLIFRTLNAEWGPAPQGTGALCVCLPGVKILCVCQNSARWSFLNL